jgi:hypothetical protein
MYVVPFSDEFAADLLGRPWHVNICSHVHDSVQDLYTESEIAFVMGPFDKN